MRLFTRLQFWIARRSLIAGAIKRKDIELLVELLDRRANIFPLIRVARLPGWDYNGAMLGSKS